MLRQSLSKKKNYEKTDNELTKKTAMDLGFEDASGAESFGFIAASVPLPLHLLQSKISKNDAHTISRMVAMRVNEAMARAARTVQYVAKAPIKNSNRTRILDNTKFTIKYGDKAKNDIKKLFNKTKSKFQTSVDLED